MDTYLERIKKIVSELDRSTPKVWTREFLKEFPDCDDYTEQGLWAASELIKNFSIGPEYGIELISTLTRSQAWESGFVLHDRSDQDVLSEKERGSIRTTQGVTCWLLYYSIVRHEPSTLPVALRLTEYLLSSVRPYVRLQAMVPLSGLAAIRYATLRSDGVTPFELPDYLRQDIERVVFENLSESVKVPRLLERAIPALSYLRRLGTDTALTKIQEIVYKDHGFQRDYVLEEAAITIAFWAFFAHDIPRDNKEEFRAIIDSIVQSPEVPEGTRLHYLFVLNKAIQENKKAKNRSFVLGEYLAHAAKLFIENVEMTGRASSGIEMIVESLISENLYPEAIEIYKLLMEQIGRLEVVVARGGRGIWLLHTPEILKKIEIYDKDAGYMLKEKVLGLIETERIIMNRSKIMGNES